MIIVSQQERDYWVKIENLGQYIINVPSYHPDHPKYLPFWKEQKRRVIEGIWGTESKGFRYCPGTIYFYGNFYTIIDTDKKQKTRKIIKPHVRDIEWHRAYNFITCQGFSGFELDENISCDKALINEVEMDDARITPERYAMLLRPDGTFKQYEDPLHYVKRLHQKELGLPLYWNKALNISELGCLGAETMVRMFDGTVKAAKDIIVGDLLMGPDSTSREVKELIRGKNQLYEVKSRYNDSYIVSDTHALQVIEDKMSIDISLEELDESHTAQTAKIEYPKKDLMWHPYVLGLWIGDGFKREKMICGSWEDHKTLDWLKNHVDTNPLLERYHITTYTGSLGKKPLWRFSWVDSRMKYKNNWFSKTLQNNKHIPNEYLTTSLEDRYELLAGLIDSDGSYDGNRYTFTNTDYQLLKQIQEVARSCGFRASLNSPRIGGVTGKSVTYNLRITGDITNIPCKLQRKKATHNSAFKQGDRPNTITITPLKVDDFYGFEVDKDHLFVLEDYTVTHNSRGGGKSYWYSGLAAREILIDGQKYYDPINKNKITVVIGSGNTDKSSDLSIKIRDGIEELSKNHLLGVYGKVGEDDYTPCPLYTQMTGDITPNNKSNAFRHEYKVKHKGELRTKGTGTTLNHVSYFAQKKGGGAESAAGGRYNISIVEEAGITSNVLEVHFSNRATLRTEGIKFGVECYIGTSGNMELAQGIRKIFENPSDYECLSFEDVFELKGRIGFFLPSYMVDQRFKDLDGNTDLDKAKTFYLKELDSQRTSEARNAFKMNYPIYPSDMWITKEDSILPKKYAEDRLKELYTNDLYKSLRTFVDLKWNNNKVEYTIIDEKKAVKIDTFRESQGSNDSKNKGLKSTKCDFIIYEFPQADAHPDTYKFIGLDPYVSDETSGGESLGATYILKNPKYIHEGQTGDIIVAEYVAKPGTRDEYSRNVELLLGLYNNPRRSLMFERNRGEKIEEYFKKVHKEYLLALQPSKYVDGKVKLQQILKYGHDVGNQHDKLELLNQFAEWLLEKTTFNGETKYNIQRICSVGLLDEILNYDFQADKDKDANYDRISAMLGCIVARKEGFNQLKDNTQVKKYNLDFFANDPKLKQFKGI